MKKVFLLSLLCLALLAATPSFAGIVIVGNPPDPGTGNRFPFGFAYDGEYQQVYSHTQFSGPINITNLEFFNTQLNNFSTSLPTGTYTISLYTTPADWNTLSPIMALNLGVGHQVFSGSIAQPWTFGDTLTINLQSSFTYDPSMGNLLMDVQVSNAFAGGGSTFFDTNGYNNGGDNGNDFLGRVYCNSGTNCGGVGIVNSGYGLVTGFSTGSGTTPEPGTIALFGSGMLGLAGVLRRKMKI